MLNLSNQTFLTKGEMRKLAPSIFQTKGAPNTSEHYSHISTERIIDDMALLGWNVVDCKEVKARKADTIGYQKHLVVFRNNNIFIKAEDGDDACPQILLTNSHDGKNAFTFTAGIFRIICENGLVICSKEFENLKIRHMGYEFEELEKVVNTLVEKLPLTIECMNEFKQTQLSQKQIIKFANDAIKLRFKPEELEIIDVNIDELLTPTRFEDGADDLWSVYNLIQEKLVHGMFNYSYGTKNRKARKIKNFKQDMELNSKLYELAAEYAN